MDSSDGRVMNKPMTGIASNTLDCFRTFVGDRMRGYFRSGGDSFLVFEDGRALVFHHETGAYWVAQRDAVTRELDHVAQELKKQTDALADALRLAGVGA